MTAAATESNRHQLVPDKLHDVIQETEILVAFQTVLTQEHALLKDGAPAAPVIYCMYTTALPPLAAECLPDLQTPHFCHHVRDVDAIPLIDQSSSYWCRVLREK